MGRIQTHKDLRVYQLSYELAMEIFEISRSFPKEERYALTSQIRNSSRSVAANLAEAFRKRRYKKHLLQSFQIRKEKVQKLKHGLILPEIVNTSPLRHVMI